MNGIEHVCNGRGSKTEPIVNLTVFAIILAITSAIIELASIFFIDRRLTREHDFIEERGTFGDQLHEYLIHQDNPESPTNLQVIAQMFTHTMMTGFKAQNAGLASGDSRRANMVQNKVFEYIASNNPDIGLAKKIGEQLGLEEGDLPLIIHALKKFGLGDLIPSIPTPTSKSSDAFKV